MAYLIARATVADQPGPSSIDVYIKEYVWNPAEALLGGAAASPASMLWHLLVDLITSSAGPLNVVNAATGPTGGSTDDLHAVPITLTMPAVLWGMVRPPPSSTSPFASACYIATAPGLQGTLRLADVANPQSEHETRRAGYMYLVISPSSLPPIASAQNALEAEFNARQVFFGTDGF
jgi:hypothetical protein